MGARKHLLREASVTAAASSDSGDDGAYSTKLAPIQWWVWNTLLTVNFRNSALLPVFSSRLSPATALLSPHPAVAG